MQLSTVVKKMTGQKGLEYLKKIRGDYHYLRYGLGNKQRYILTDDSWELEHIYQDKDRNVFFGYYDIQQFNGSLNKFLLTKIPLEADTEKDKAELYCVDAESGEQTLLARSSAWCWQQGSRLRWYPGDDNKIIFNDVEADHYVARVWDIKENSLIKTYPRALYDVTPDMKYGFSLNYSRLQRLRPGYGYNTLPDNTEKDRAPKHDGLFKVDLVTGEVSLLISLEQLSKQEPESTGLWNYINHISVSPSGKKLIFFHIWTPNAIGRWMVNLYCINTDGTDLKCLESKYRSSHYCWIDDDNVLMTEGGFPNNESRYIMYNVATGEKKIVNESLLIKDGHPSVFLDKSDFITDTYPLGQFYQQVYISNVNTEKKDEILRVFHDPRMYEERRCDLHPRLTPDGCRFSIDTTCIGGKRAVMVFKKSNCEK